MTFKDELYASLELAHVTLLQAREIELTKQSTLQVAQLRLRLYQNEILVTRAPEDLGKNETVRAAKIAQMTQLHAEEVRSAEALLNQARFERENAEITWQYARKRIDLYGMEGE